MATDPVSQLRPWPGFGPGLDRDAQLRGAGSAAQTLQIELSPPEAPDELEVAHVVETSDRSIVQIAELAAGQRRRSTGEAGLDQSYVVLVPVDEVAEGVMDAPAVGHRFPAARLLDQGNE
jgi:hypothetical protein